MNQNKKIIILIAVLLLTMPSKVFANNSSITIINNLDYNEQEEIGTIEKIDLSKATVSGIKTKIYNGKAQRQDIKVILGEDLLKKNQDYKVTYKNNYSTGKASMIITGTGDYEGKITRTFRIIPSRPVVSVKSKTNHTITFTWKKISTSTGYQIAFRQMGPNKYKYYTVTTTNKKFTNLKSKRYHQMKVRAYKLIDGKKYYGSWSYVKKVRTY